MTSPKQIAVGTALGLMLFSMIGCNRSAKITSFTASPMAFTAGQSAQLCYELVNAVNASIDSVGKLSDTTKSCVKVEPRETTTYTLQASGANGVAVTSQLTLNVTAPPPLANIVTFEAKRQDTAAAPGSAADLCYEVTGARTLAIDQSIGNIEPVDKGCHSVKPDRTTTYELSATGTDNQTVTKEATVKVVQPKPRIVKFDVSPESIKAGEKVTVCYQVEGATQASISNVNRALTLGSPDCFEAWPKQTLDLTFAARNLDSESVSQTRKITVEQPPVVIDDFSAQSTDVEFGSDALLHYKVSNAARVWITPDDKGGEVPRGEGNVKRRAARPTTTYTLTAVDIEGKASKASIAVTVVPPAQARILSFGPSTQVVVPPKGGQLCYEVTWGATVSIVSPATNTTLPTDSSEKNCVSVPARDDRYTLTAIGTNKNRVTRDAVVNLAQSSVEFEVWNERRQHGSIVTVGRGESVILCYAVNNVQWAQITPGPFNVAAGKRCLKPIKITADAPFTLNYTRYDGTGDNKQVSVKVSPPPKILRFDNRDPRYGPGVLCYEVANGARATITPGWPTVQLPRGCVRLPPNPTYPYTLKVLGFGKDASGKDEFDSRSFPPK